MRRYTEHHARAGLESPLPKVECWENQYRGYQIEVVIPEYTSICPKTGLPDFGTIHIDYEPDRWCLELKSLKEYIHAYRNLGIFYENAVNRILRDLAGASKPHWMKVRGEFTPRGGLRTSVEARYEKRSPRLRKRATER